MDAHEQLAALLLTLEENIRKDSEELETHLERAKELEAKISRARRHIESFRAALPDLGDDQGTAFSVIQSGRYKAFAEEKYSESKHLRRFAEEVLRDADAPMPQSLLTGAIARKGFEFRAKNPVDLLRSALRRDPRFVNIKGAGWTLSTRSP